MKAKKGGKRSITFFDIGGGEKKGPRLSRLRVPTLQEGEKIKGLSQRRRKETGVYQREKDAVQAGEE